MNLLQAIESIAESKSVDFQVKFTLFICKQELGIEVKLGELIPAVAREA